MWWEGFVAGVCLALVIAALLMGAGMILYRRVMDSAMGYDWRDDWKQTIGRWLK